MLNSASNKRERREEHADQILDGIEKKTIKMFLFLSSVRHRSPLALIFITRKIYDTLYSVLF